MEEGVRLPRQHLKSGQLYRQDTQFHESGLTSIQYIGPVRESLTHIQRHPYNMLEQMCRFQNSGKERLKRTGILKLIVFMRHPIRD